MNVIGNFNKKREKNWKRKMNGGRESGFEKKKAKLNGLRRLKNSI